ncbi:serine hydrolase [Phenylobacterium sp.]|uniref:serine hydrolase domain-containing protein n=1 Tax=Phenylobacterium sp. TaxID=1871053 RepID=UPI00273327B5|nr:serine hydrolase [Phenylobacterium sp.]MDP3854978.1 serine hydrolase [Phenylobacterium sp.]
MSLMPLPAQPADVAWPTEAWPLGELPAGLDQARFDAQLARAFETDEMGQTHALAIVQGGRLIFERYGRAHGPDHTYPSWSMAKSITQALVGVLVGEGLIDIHAPADVPEWREPGDPRGAVTLDQLLRMSSGLRFVEDYVPEHPSDVIEMLQRSGRPDMAHFAAAMPLEHAPGTWWSYASGTTNIVSRIAARAVGATGEAFHAFMRQALFDPLGMKSPVPKFDGSGTFIGSSYCFATARDFARFGLLYLRGGEWDGRQLLSRDWVDYARTPTFQQPGEENRYGAHWWLDVAGPGSFSANGYDGQYIVLVPDLDLILVRHGATPLAKKDVLKAWVGEAVACFR